MDHLMGHFLDAHHALAVLFIGGTELSGGGVFPDDDIIAVENSKGLIAHKFLGAQNRMAQTLGLLLADEGDVGEVGNSADLVIDGLLAACQAIDAPPVQESGRSGPQWRPCPDR